MGLSSQSVRYGPPLVGMIRTRWLGSETRFGLVHVPRAKDCRKPFVLTRGSHPLPPQRYASCCALGQRSKLLRETRLSSRPCHSLVGWCDVGNSIGFGLQRASSGKTGCRLGGGCG